MRDNNTRLVYSTDGGRVREARAAPTPGKRSPESPSMPEDGVVRVHRAKSPKGGKVMTAVSGLPGSENELDRALKRFKAALGTGGVREGRMLLLQGDHRERLLAEIMSMGLKVKLAGG